MATVSSASTLRIGLDSPDGARLSAMAMGLCRVPNDHREDERRRAASRGTTM